MSRVACAIYTRKSSDEGLDKEFNSLDAQREACAAYVASQKHEGWVGLPTPYDDGGYSGGSMDRPALRMLLADITARKIDVVVVYKVDRLTRALADFAKIVEVFDAHGVSFVSVTQAFNTTTSMGRLTLNVLLSFAQFEREVTGERIRDKIAASKKKGLWMGGFVPFGYRANGRTLIIKDAEACIVRTIFAHYRELGTVRAVETELARRPPAMPSRTTKAGRVYGDRQFSRGQIYKLLSNPIYCGDISHKGTRYPGQHPAIIPVETFTKVAVQLAANGHERKVGRNAQVSSLLAGLVVDVEGNKLVATHANKHGKRYRYYISKALHAGRTCGRPSRNQMLKAEAEGTMAWRLPAAEIEAIVVREISALLLDQTRLIEIAKEIEPHRLWSMPDWTQLARIGAMIANSLAGEDPATARTLMLKFITKIEIATGAVTIVFNPDGMISALGFETEAGRVNISDAPRLTIPIVLRRRGVETKLILTQAGHAQPEPNRTLIRALARARRWMAELIEGKHPSVEALAKAYHTDKRYVARHLPLACLSPAIIDASLDGRQPVELTTWDLLNRVDTPFAWTDQARRLGFP